jgi:hypothetical protein
MVCKFGYEIIYNELNELSLSFESPYSQFSNFQILTSSDSQIKKPCILHTSKR